MIGLFKKSLMQCKQRRVFSVDVEESISPTPFTIESMHRHGGHVKISHVGNCKSEKLSQKFWFFCDYLKNCVEFWHSICAGLWRSGLYRTAAKSLGISLKLFRQRVANFFIGVHLKVHWRFTV